MSKHEIDIMWQKAMKQSIEDGEMFTRYHFAKLVAERALADSMREVQRLGQEIKQEHVALHIGWLVRNSQGKLDLLTKLQIDSSLEKYERLHKLYTTPPQRTEQEPTAKYSDIVSDGGLDPRNKFDVSPQRTEPVIDKSAAKRIATILGWTPPRTWVGLTDDEIWEAYMKAPLALDCSTDELYAISRTVEAKLKEKNT